MTRFRGSRGRRRSRRRWYPRGPAGGRSRRGRRRPSPHAASDQGAAVVTETAQTPRSVVLPERVSVRDLAELLQVGPPIVLKELLDSGVVATVNRELDHETAVAVTKRLGIEVEEPEATNGTMAPAATTAPPATAVDDTGLEPRPPVVAIMGHVDHGKTSILDVVRKTRVAAHEAGGITQHIGAYQITHEGKPLTFLDTPGHEAFTALRARGAQVTDIAVIVVAADDGVQPQTVEAISHVRAANTPFMIAINKIDRRNANIERVRQQLAEIDVVVEEYGGDVVAVPVSATTGQGIDDLLEMIVLVSDLQELRANPEGPAQGTVIESRLDRSQGPVATVIIQNGTLQVGDYVVADGTGGRVRALLDEAGRRLRQIGPSTPAELLGLERVPIPGDQLEVVDSERTVRSLVAAREEARHAESAGRPRRSLDDLLAQLQPDQTKELPIVLKADVHGSLEALRGALARLETDEARVHILYSAVGGVTDSDVNLAAAEEAIILAFNVRLSAAVRQLAERTGVEIRSYDVIYNLLDDVEQTLQRLVQPEVQEVVLGHAEIRATFRTGRTLSVVGCYVQNGVVRRGARARIRRHGSWVYNGRIASLRRFKDEVEEVPESYECGIGLENFPDPQVGDIIETYGRERVTGTEA